MINEIKTKTAIITAEAVGNQILVTHQYRHAKTGVERVNRYWLNKRHVMRLIKFKQLDAFLRYAKAFDESVKSEFKFREAVKALPMPPIKPNKRIRRMPNGKI